MASPQYFDFINNVWKNLPDKDKQRMAELWNGYEQVIAAAYQKHIEARLDAYVADMLTYNEERWLPYTFNSTNFISKAAVFRSIQDLSVGVNLTSKYLIKFSWDGNPAIEVDVRGINPASTTIFEIVDKINVAAGFAFVKTVVNDALLEFTSPTAGPLSSIQFLVPSSVPNDGSEFVLGLLTLELPRKYPQFPYPYKSQYPSLVSVPAFRTTIRNENEPVTLTQDTDYAVSSSGEISFMNEPPSFLWAKRSFFNEETPWNNFGFLLDIYQANSARYVQIIQGLWFAFWTGPKPENLRRALYLLFGLPTSPFNGTVTEATTSFITIVSDTGEVSRQPVPSDLVPIVAIGQRVKLFDPLVSGIVVLDKVNTPGFIRDEIGREGIKRFLLDEATLGSDPNTDESKALRMLEEYTFLPQISVEAFISPDINIRNVRLFLDAIKPVVKTYLFQVIVGTFRDELIFEEKHSLHWSSDLTPNVDSNETTYQTSDILDAHETTANPGLCLDTEGLLLRDSVEIEVRSFGSLIDTFEV